jgi:hypothetical protein
MANDIEGGMLRLELIVWSVLLAIGGGALALVVSVLPD